MKMSPEFKNWISVFIIVATVAAGSLASLTIGTFESIRGELMTFWVSFFVGMAGAGVYLSLLLMTEKNLEILKNTLVPNIRLMAMTFLMSGGFVAAVIQTSTGILTNTSIHAVFMLGFGWQGAISGVAGTGTRAQLAESLNDKTIDASRAEEKAEAVRLSLENKIDKLRDELMRARKEKAGEE